MKILDENFFPGEWYCTIYLNVIVGVKKKNIFTETQLKKLKILLKNSCYLSIIIKLIYFVIFIFLCSLLNFQDVYLSVTENCFNYNMVPRTWHHTQGKSQSEQDVRDIKSSFVFHNFLVWLGWHKPSWDSSLYRT